MEKLWRYDEDCRENILACFNLGIELGDLNYLAIIKNWLRLKADCFDCEKCGLYFSNCDCYHCKNCNKNHCICEYEIYKRCSNSQFRNIIRLELWELVNSLLNSSELENINKEISKIIEYGKTHIFFSHFSDDEWNLFKKMIKI